MLYSIFFKLDYHFSLLFVEQKCSFRNNLQRKAIIFYNNGSHTLFFYNKITKFSSLFNNLHFKLFHFIFLGCTHQLTFSLRMILLVAVWSYLYPWRTCSLPHEQNVQEISINHPVLALSIYVHY